jgi:hypothetical protein
VARSGDELEGAKSTGGGIFFIGGEEAAEADANADVHVHDLNDG